MKVNENVHSEGMQDTKNGRPAKLGEMRIQNELG